MSSIRLRGRPALLLVATLAAVSIGLLVLIGARSYRAAHSLLEADPPSPLLKHPEQSGLPDVQAIGFTSPEGRRVAGWYSPSRNRAAVIVAHGTNSDRTSMLWEMRRLAQAGFGVLAFDWPGLGESDGPIRWDASSRDALTSAIDWLGARPDIDPERLGGLGFSMGGFVMAQVAATDHRLHAVVLESSPGNFEDYVRLHYSKRNFVSEWPARWALRDSGLLGYHGSASQVIGGISPTPLLFIVGSKDEEVPTAMVTALYESAGRPKTLWVVPDADHGGYARAAGDEYGRRLQEFFVRNLLAQAPAGR